MKHYWAIQNAFAWGAFGFALIIVAALTVAH
jgi:hypothetical protein